MNSTLFVIHIYITRILLITCLTYAFLSQGCPACVNRLETNSPAFFAEETEPNTAKTEKNKPLETKIETKDQEVKNA